MNWVKNHYDQFALAILSLGVLGSAYVLWSKIATFEDTFADAKAAPAMNNTIAAVDTVKIDTAREHFQKPTTWQPRPVTAGSKTPLIHSGLLFTSERYLLTKFNTLEKPTKGALYSDSLTGKPIDNNWFLDHGLALLDSSVQFQDPDTDGFLNEDEWRHKTDPNKKESHPNYETKLFLKQWLKQPFRFKFQAYDGEPTKPQEMNFQVNPLDAGGRTKFLKMGELVEGTKFKVAKFEFKEADNPGTGDKTEVSELTIENEETGDKVVLILNKVIDSPTQFAQFEYFWNKPHNAPGLVFVVQKLKVFALQPKVDQKDLYKLLDVNEAGALIQRPDGQQYQVPLVPKKQ